MPPVDDKTLRRNVKDLVTSSTRVKANFVVLAGVDIGRKYPLNKNSLQIGRNESCDIFIDDEDVSRNHARIEIKEDLILLEDLGSTNGTLVNGKEIKTCVLKDGDRIQIGNTTVLKFNFLDDIEDTYNERLYTAANKDYLTGIYNKKYLLDRLRMEISYARRHQTPLSLIIFDLDFFKQVNDEYGHLAGDQILKQMAAHIVTMKRQEDLFARYGGEEFVLLLRDTPKETAIQIAEKLRSRIEELPFVVDENHVQISISIGVATFLRNNYKNGDTFLRAADQQLYKAKKEGRNRVHFTKEGLPSDFKIESDAPN